ncbi:hypothetical protein [Sulfurovum sp. NBC37-1]|uniref:hypothetical protein n=1 Tax=Sulfurovum sp. (strain NBC37-1) TaxID=387093 RepID=UPI0001587C4B|nr:hypothetical protein [Sulfurovum sp. NBC37-1]BAF72553.1 hypothetical protein SUN_1603 [Sulfurovum sp. NBC37-1]
MKQLLMLFLVVHTVQAAETPIYQTSLYTGTVSLFLLLAGISIILMRGRARDRQLLQEKEEKILQLSQDNMENEQRHLQREREFEKEILKQAHTIENLELKLKEGTKNQVVSKIEELQKKRQAAQGRLGEEV